MPTKDLSRFFFWRYWLTASLAVYKRVGYFGKQGPQLQRTELRNSLWLFRQIRRGAFWFFSGHPKVGTFPVLESTSTCGRALQLLGSKLMDVLEVNQSEESL